MMRSIGDLISVVLFFFVAGYAGAALLFDWPLTRFVWAGVLLGSIAMAKHIINEHRDDA